MFQGSGTWLFILDYGLLFNKRQVIETCDTPTVRQVERRYGWFGSITLVGEGGPNTLVHSVERLRAIHEREGGNVSQVDLGQIGVVLFQLGSIGLAGDRLDDCIGSWVFIVAIVAIPVVLGSSELTAHKLADTVPWLSRAGGITTHH